MYVVILGVALVLIVGTFWPNSLDWLLPSSMHYSAWPFWLKLFGWLCVVGLAIVGLIPQSKKQRHPQSDSD